MISHHSYALVYKIYAGLEAFSISAEQYGSFLIPIIMNSLPADVCLQIVRITTKDIWEIEELLQILRIEVEAREISDRVKVTKIHNPASIQELSINSICIDST